MNKYVITLVIAVTVSTVNAQLQVDLKKVSQFKVINRTIETLAENGRTVLKMSEAPSDGLAILNDVQFKNGTIEFDVKGRNVLQASFVGVAFLVQDDGRYDAVYFRPFNFMNEDTVRRHRSVQYISAPDYPWEKLRAQYPGKYEHKVIPVPNADDWFHAKVVVDGRKVIVFVNHSPTPSLEVERLTNVKEGKVALWTGNGSNGSFSNLVITPARPGK